MDFPIVWSSKLQSQIALSTMEAEYISLASSMRELIAIREVLKEICNHVLDENEFANLKINTKSTGFKNIPQLTVHEDNSACLQFATMQKMSPRTKHIAIPYHFFRAKVKELEINVVPIATEYQLADQFTKELPVEKFVRDRKALMGW